MYGIAVWDLWGIYGASMGIYGEITSVCMYVCVNVCDCGADPMGDLWDCVCAAIGFAWTYGDALLQLWGPMGLHLCSYWVCLDLWGCSVASMGLYFVVGYFVYGVPMGLTYGLLWLRCRPYGASMGRCGCGADPMGYLWGAVAAVPSVWGIYGVLWLRSHSYGVRLFCQKVKLVEVRACRSEG